MVLLIDNYDSFSYNLYQSIGAFNAKLKVIRNNELSIEEIKKLHPSHIVISPGPGRPENAGNIIEVIKELKDYAPILGVCLGHQAICAAFGTKISYAKELMHGKQSTVLLDRHCPLFTDMPSPRISVGRYHSLAAVEDTLPSCFLVTARTEDDEIMAVMHKQYPIYGLQFHPESILTPVGPQILKNFLNGKGD